MPCVQCYNVTNNEVIMPSTVMGKSVRVRFNDDRFELVCESTGRVLYALSEVSTRIDAGSDDPLTATVTFACKEP